MQRYGTDKPDLRNPIELCDLTDEFNLGEVKFDAFKIESNGKNYKIIKNLVKSGIPIMGHIGYTPQFKKNFKVQGRKKKEETQILKDLNLKQVQNLKNKN